MHVPSAAAMRVQAALRSLVVADCKWQRSRKVIFATWRRIWRNRHIEHVDHLIGGPSEQRHQGGNRSGLTLRSAVEIARELM